MSNDVDKADKQLVALIEGIEEILQLEPGSLKGDSEFKSHADWDSLAALSAMVLIEDLFNKVIDPSILKSSRTIAELFDALTAGR